MLIAKVIWQWMKACSIIPVQILCLPVEKTEKVHLEAKLRISFKLTRTLFTIPSIQRWRKSKISKLFYRKTINYSFWIYAKESKTQNKVRKHRKKTSKKLLKNKTKWLFWLWELWNISVLMKWSQVSTFCSSWVSLYFLTLQMIIHKLETKRFKHSVVLSFKTNKSCISIKRFR